MPSPSPALPAGGFAERVCAARKPLWITDLVREARLPPDSLAGRLGLRTAFASPILAGEEILGVMQYFDREARAPDADLIRMMAAIGGQIGQFIERRQAEKAQRESEAQVRAILQSSMDGFWLVDTQGRLLEVNQTYCRMSGYDARELLSLRISDLEVVETTEDTAAHIRRIMVRGEDRFESRHRRKDGSVFDVEISVQWRPAQGGRLVVFLRDISERKLLEEQLRRSQKMEAIARLAGWVAHDFTNILSATMALAYQSRKLLETDHPVRERMEEIERVAQRGAALTGQLLAFSRRQILQPKVLDINQVVTELAKMLPSLLGADVELVTSLAPDLGHVKVDFGQIDQVLTNLVVNSRDAMPQGGSVTITTENVDLGPGPGPHLPDLPPATGRFVMLAVSDSGCGMDERTLSHLFEPFFTTKERGKGTGLGLSIAYNIVRQSGGHIEVDSRPGGGTTFRIYLPRVDGTMEAAATPPAAPPGRTRGTETVLLVEDEARLREALRDALAEHGYTVLVAPDGAAAVEIGLRHPGPIDLLVTDVMMPKLNGTDLADRIAPLRPRLKVLFISGYMADAAGHCALERPGTSILEKPFPPDVLVRVVRDIFDAPFATRRP